MTQKSSKRTSTKIQSSGGSLHGIFYRWLIAGLLGITFYLVGVLILALYVKSSDSGDVDAQGSFITSVLFTFALISVFWWLIESARAIMLYISRHSKPAKKKAVAKKK